MARALAAKPRLLLWDEPLAALDAQAQDELLDLLRGLVDRLETQTLLSGEHDARNAIVTIHPGAGGTESQDWAEMLLRMYLRWAERHNFDAQIIEMTEGEEAGIKSVTLEVRGRRSGRAFSLPLVMVIPGVSRRRIPPTRLRWIRDRWPRFSATA